MSEFVCMYHRVDMDGMLSGELIRRHVENVYQKKCEMFGFNYEKDVNAKYLREKYPEMRVLYIVDSSLHPDDIIELQDAGIKVIWMDHHKSIIDEFVNDNRFVFERARCKDCPTATIARSDAHPNKPFAYVSLTNTKSGCRLVYDYLCQNNRTLIDEHPACAILSEIVSIFDVWNQQDPKWEDAQNFIVATTMYNLFPGSDDWNTFFIKNDPEKVTEVIQENIDRGQMFRGYQKQCDAHTARRYAGTLIWEGKRFCVINSTRIQSQVVDSVFDQSIHDAVLIFVFDPSGVWKVSMYSSDRLDNEVKQNLDLSIIARKHGGGGHRLACGFSCEKLPFNVSDIEPIVSEDVR